MKGLRKFRLEQNASIWYFSKLSMLSIDQYLKFEGMKDENIPHIIKQRLRDIMNMEGEIKNYYKNAEAFYKSNSLKEILDNAELDYDIVAADIGVGVNVVRGILEDNEPFPDDNTRDKLIDYTMWVKDNVVGVEDNYEYENIESEVQKDILGPEELQFPEMPSQDFVSNDEVGESKDAEIAGLNRQIDWYEELLTCFTNLAALAYKNNK